MPFIQLQFRRGTALEWSSTLPNPILAAGELGIETDTNQFKIGDGVLTWNALPYGGLQGPPGSFPGDATFSTLRVLDTLSTSSTFTRFISAGTAQLSSLQFVNPATGGLSNLYVEGGNLYYAGTQLNVGGGGSVGSNIGFSNVQVLDTLSTSSTFTDYLSVPVIFTSTIQYVDGSLVMYSVNNVSKTPTPNYASTFFIVKSIGDLGTIQIGSLTSSTSAKTTANPEQKSNAIAIGANAGKIQNSQAIAIGGNAGSTGQSTNSIAIGFSAGLNEDSGISIFDNTIAIGAQAGSGLGSGIAGQKQNAIAIGYEAGRQQGENAIAIGAFAGSSNDGALPLPIVYPQAAASIVLNATGEPLVGTEPSSFYVAPVRTVDTSLVNFSTLFYNNDTKEIVAGPIPAGGGGSVGSNIGFSNVQVLDTLSTSSTFTKYISAPLILTSKLQFVSTTMAIGSNVGISQSDNAIAIGYNSGISQSAGAVAIGESAGGSSQGINSVAIGVSAGFGQNIGGVAIGNNAGFNQQLHGIAIGSAAGLVQSQYSIAIGSESGGTQGDSAIAIGRYAGNSSQQQNAIAIGSGAGQSQQLNTIAIGADAGSLYQSTNTIILNASGSALNTTQSNALYIAPIASRDTYATFSTLFYDNDTKEVFAGPVPAGGGGSVGSNIGFSNVQVLDTLSTSSTFTNYVSAAQIYASSLVVGSAYVFGSNTLTVAGSTILQGPTTVQGDLVFSGTNFTVNSTFTNYLSAPQILTSTIQYVDGSILMYSIKDFGDGIREDYISTVFKVNPNTDAFPESGAIRIGSQTTNTIQDFGAIAIGANAGVVQAQQAIALGYGAGQIGQSTSAIAIGTSAGLNAQNEFSVAIGALAGRQFLGSNSIAIGKNALQGDVNPQGMNNIAIGAFASDNPQSYSSTIVLSALGDTALNPDNNAAFYVAPVRTVDTSLVNFSTLFYNNDTKEIVAGPVPAGGGGSVGSNIGFSNVRVLNTLSTSSTFTNYISATQMYASSLVVGSAFITGSNTLTVAGSTIMNGFTLTNSGAQSVSMKATVSGGAPATQTVEFTTVGEDTFTVPSGVTSIRVKLWGAGGGAYNDAQAGNGAYVEGDISVTPNETLSLLIGIGGDPNANDPDLVTGGGRSGGAGRTEILRNSTRLAVAGGGGGAVDTGVGGNAGITTGSAGGNQDNATGGGGGTQSAGGAGGLGWNGQLDPAYDGAPGNGPQGGTSQYTAGGGGGGYYGGGSGGRDNDVGYGAGGGGGSSYTGGLTGTVTTYGGNQASSWKAVSGWQAGRGVGANTGAGSGTVIGGDGLMLISYTLPSPSDLTITGANQVIASKFSSDYVSTGTTTVSTLQLVNPATGGLSNLYVESGSLYFAGSAVGGGSVGSNIGFSNVQVLDTLSTSSTFTEYLSASQILTSTITFFDTIQILSENNKTSVQIGNNLGGTASDAVAIGNTAGVDQLNDSIAIGSSAGSQSQSSNAIAIGSTAASQGQSAYAVAVGYRAASVSQNENSVAIGSFAGESYLGSNSIAIGYSALLNTSATEPTGMHNIAIGAYASLNSGAWSSTIVLNASGEALNPTSNASFYVKPIRAATTSDTLYYDTASGEITYGAAGGGSVGSNIDFSNVRVMDTLSTSSTFTEFLSAPIILVSTITFNEKLQIETLVNNAPISIGRDAGLSNQAQGSEFSIAIGASAGRLQQENCVALGSSAGSVGMSTASIAIGALAGARMDSNAIAIGTDSGNFGIGINSIAIGKNVGQNKYVPQSTIILNATGQDLPNPYTADSFYVKPIRAATTSDTLYYDTISGEITYGAGGGINSNYAFSNLTVADTLSTSSTFTNYISAAQMYASSLVVGSAFVFGSNTLTVAGSTIMNGPLSMSGSTSLTWQQPFVSVAINDPTSPWFSPGTVLRVTNTTGPATKFFIETSLDNNTYTGLNGSVLDINESFDIVYPLESLNAQYLKLSSNTPENDPTTMVYILQSNASGLIDNFTMSYPSDIFSLTAKYPSEATSISGNAITTTTLNASHISTTTTAVSSLQLVNPSTGGLSNLYVNSGNLYYEGFQINNSLKAGSGATDGTSNATINFDVNFPNAITAVVATYSNADTTLIPPLRTSSWSVNGFTVSGEANSQFSWLAFGN
jgi:hypothetical protein